jgi:DNA-binding CsgD family transcriptional regulator/PAS domain-containing protein
MPGDRTEGGVVPQESQIPLDLVGGIYEAALEPQRWHGVLEQLEGYLSASSSMMLLQDVEAKDASFVSSRGLGPKLMQAYCDYYFYLDPNIAFRKDKPEGTVTASHLIVPEPEWAESEYYRDFMRHFDAYYTAGAVVMRDPRRIGTFGVQRPRRGGPFGEGELARLRGVLPHLRRAFQISRQLAAGEVERQAMLALLERLPTGVLLLDEHRRVVFLNRRAESILAAGDGLTMTAQGLQVTAPGLQPALERLIQEAVETGAGRGSGSGGALALPAGAGHDSYQVLVAPLRTNRVRMDVGRERICAALFVQLRNAQPALSMEVLRDLFGLTPAEARVAVALVHGRKPEEIAAASDTSRFTVRAQLSSIYEKLGVHRQAEVVQRVLSSPAVLSDGNHGEGPS